MKLSQRDVEQFGEILVRNIQKEFSIKYLSKNLVDTIEIIQTPDTLQVVIPAEVYDMYKYQKDKIILHNRGAKSYASALDSEGSTVLINGKFVHLGNHEGYIDEVIRASLQEWIALKEKYEFVSKTEL